MKRITYYYVPTAYSNADEKVCNLINDSKENITEIVMVDSIENKDKKTVLSFFHKCDFFTDDYEFVVEILWDIKGIYEKIYLINNVDSNCVELLEQGEVMPFIRRSTKNLMLVYCLGKEPKKIIIFENETIRAFVRNNMVKEFVDTISKYASEDSFENRELGG